MSGIKSPPWVCVTCYKPIHETDGIIEIFNNNLAAGPVGVFPVLPTDDAAFETPNVDFRVYHRDVCDPDRFQASGFVIHTGQADTLEKWVWWTEDLFDKPWMGREDLRRFLNFWWRNRLLEPPTPT